jgi:O-antigen/teichoic acid export membrane protein
VSFLLLAFLARALGPDGFGPYTATLGIAAFVLVAIEGGWAARLYRAQVDHATGAGPPPPVAHAVAHVLLAAVVAIALALMAGAGPALLLALGAMLPVALANLVSARLRGEGRFGREASWQAGARVVSALAILAAVFLLAPRAEWVFLAWGTSLGVMLIALARPHLAAPRIRGLAPTYRGALAFATLDLGAILVARGDMAVIWLASLPLPALADYGVGTRFTEAAVLAFAPVNNVLLGHLRRARPDPARYRRRTLQALGLALAFGAAALLACLVFGPLLITTMFGAPYARAADALPWIAASLPLLLGNLVLLQAGIAAGAERAVSRLVLATALPMLAAPVAGGLLAHDARGVALGWLAAQALLFAPACLVALRKVRP